jgi:lipopolysaccharide O-acetyltransferase
MAIHIGPRAYLRGLSCIRIGPGFESAEGLWLEALTSFAGQTFAPKIVIEDRVHVGRYAHIAAVNNIEIGSDVLIGSNVLITDHNHGTYNGVIQSDPTLAPIKRHLVSSGPVVIGRNAWIGDQAVITPGCVIGEGAIIGANSVVTTNVPQFTIAAGTPARCIKAFDFDAKTWVPLT